MRLTEDQVKEAILSPDRNVREAAVYYFSRSFSPDPGILPLAIQVIEQRGRDEAFKMYSFMRELIQTDETVLWLVEQVKKCGETDEEYGYVHALRSALIHADAILLQQHDDTILQLDELDEKEKDTICQRVRLASQSPDDLWLQLEDFCQRSDKLSTVPEDLDLVDDLVEALGRHPGFSAPKVLAILNGESADNWMELCAVRLAGEMRLQERIPQIVALLNDADDWMFGEGHRALVKIGGNKAVEVLAQAYPTGSADLRSLAASILESIHSDLSVETCLNLFETEEDHHIRCSLLQSALMNFSSEGIEPARQLILTTPLDLELLEVRSDLLIACKVIGETIPEFDAWTEDAKNDVAFRKNWYRTNGFLPSLDEFDLDDEEELDEPSPDTVVRHTHVGRNDPCPCGSGKKFKKCCLKKSSSAI
jgi:hypothetical protein